jgi:Stress responsive A/B Barrel Domain.
LFIHSVYFWLKDGQSNTARLEMMADANEKLREIPTVQQLWAGPPAGTPRDIVDNSYQIGLTVVLEDAEAHEIYQSIPCTSNSSRSSGRTGKRCWFTIFLPEPLAPGDVETGKAT